MRLAAEGKPQQTITDLNLDQMVQVFNEAERKVPNSAVTPGTTKFSPENEAGVSRPIGFFDPVGFTNDITQDNFLGYQEAELKHGRLSMLAVLGVFFGEKLPVLFNGEVTGPALYHPQQVQEIFPYVWPAVLAIISIVEIISITKGFNPFGEKKFSSGYTPGRLGFDPLNLLVEGREAYNNILTREINNGRLAMLGIAGILAQEYVTGQSVF
eukprot:gene10558-11495_t